MEKAPKLTPEVAEIIGAFIGDGWIENREKALYITGHITEDRDYYDGYLAPLFSRDFACVTPKEFSYWKVYGIATYDKSAIKKALDLGFKKGRKALNVTIPKNVLDSGDFNVFCSILRGIFDTDGCFWCEKSNAKTSTSWKRTHNYIPLIGITSCSKKLLIQCQLLLRKLGIESIIKQKNTEGFHNNRNVHNSYLLLIRKISSVEKWFKLVGTKNPKHETKYLLWKKLTYLPPRTSLDYRINLLGI
jgi:hypothetical protein